MSKVYEIVAVQDNLTEAFLQPTFVGTLAEAKRLFEYQVNNIELWKENASDYDLYSLGVYNAETGEIKSEVHKLIRGSSVVRRNNNDIRQVKSTEEN